MIDVVYITYSWCLCKAYQGGGMVHNSLIKCFTHSVWNVLQVQPIISEEITKIKLQPIIYKQQHF